MRVLLIYKDYYPPVMGGIEGYLNLLAHGLNSLGIQVEVLVSSTNSTLQSEIIDGISVTKVPQIGRFNSAPLNLSLPYWIRKKAKTADIMHFQFPNPTAELSYLISGLKGNVVVTYHSDIVRQKIGATLLAPLLKSFFKRARAVMVTSPNYLKSSPLLQQFKEKCSIAPLGIDVGEFEINTDIEAKIADIHNRIGSPMILFVGKFRYYKGISVLIQAAANLDCKIVLIGSGPLEKEIREQVERERLGHKVFFLGEVSDNDKIAYLHACDIFVLPSIYRSEAFGIAQLEAMSCSKPVICTELGTGTSFVNQHEKTGLVIPPNDVDALVASVQYLLDNPALRQQYGKAGHDRVHQNFSKEKMISNVVAVYQNVMDS